MSHFVHPVWHASFSLDVIIIIIIIEVVVVVVVVVPQQQLIHITEMQDKPWTNE